jgi:DNA-directed RNA polymerase sigma subunit (sigma70/sigma32)
VSVPEDLLDLYFSELGKVRLLTAEDEVRLAKTIEAGNAAQEELNSGKKLSKTKRTELERKVREGQAAFDHFVAANLRLVVSVAAQFSKRSTLDLGELIQEGNLGLLRAVEKFDIAVGPLEPEPAPPPADDGIPSIDEQIAQCVEQTGLPQECEDKIRHGIP